MKYKVNRLKYLPLDPFMEEHGLEIQVQEGRGPLRFTARIPSFYTFTYGYEGDWREALGKESSPLKAVDALVTNLNDTKYRMFKRSRWAWKRYPLPYLYITTLEEDYFDF